jgi:hypothetical protein
MAGATHGAAIAPHENGGWHCCQPPLRRALRTSQPCGDPFSLRASVLSTLRPKPRGRSPAPSWGVAPPPLAFRLVYTASGAHHLLPLSYFPKKILRFRSGLRLIKVSLVARRSLSSTAQSCHGNRVAQREKWGLQPVDIGDNSAGPGDRRPAADSHAMQCLYGEPIDVGRAIPRKDYAHSKWGPASLPAPTVPNPTCQARRPPARASAVWCHRPEERRPPFGSILKSRSACALALVSQRLVRRPNRRFQLQFPKENRRPHRSCG